MAVDSFHSYIQEWGIQSQSFEEQLFLFVTFLLVCDKAPTTVASYVSGIKSHYKLQGVEIQNELLLSRMIRGVRNFNKGERCPRLPLLIQQLSLIIDAIQARFPRYYQILYKSMVLTMFHGLLRVREVTDTKHNLLAKNVSILTRHLDESRSLTQHQNLVTLHFDTTKSDQYGTKNQWTWFGPEKNSPCPVRAILEYIRIRPQATWFFVKPNGLPIPRPEFLQTLNEVFAQVLHGHILYHSHSLRMGGAVYLMLNGWSKEQIMAKGRWVSSETADKYCNSIHKLFSR